MKGMQRFFTPHNGGFDLINTDRNEEDWSGWWEIEGGMVGRYGEVCSPRKGKGGDRG